jgi:hypothetical protein
MALVMPDNMTRTPEPPMRLSRLLPLWFLAFAAAPALGQPVPAPCSSPEYRQFDFWLGEWEVRGPAGKLAGTNRISKEFGGCVLHERYDTGRGYSGASLNTYDRGGKRWHQTWVDSSGLLLQLDGGLVDGRMVLEGETVGAGGGKMRHRITWTPNADGSVRQLWESTNAAGDWTVAFDGKYTKAAAAK